MEIGTTVSRPFLLYLLLTLIHLSLLYVNSIQIGLPLLIYYLVWGVLVWFFPSVILAIIPFILEGFYWITVGQYTIGIVFILTSLLILWRVGKVVKGKKVSIEGENENKKSLFLL